MSIKNVTSESISLNQEIKQFISQIGLKEIREIDHKKLDQLEKNIYDLAKEIFNDNRLTSEEKTKATACLIDAKHLLTLNQAFYSDSTLEINSLYHTPPALNCASYQRNQAPFVSSYQYLSASPALVRLESSAMQAVPEEIKKAVGDLKDKKVDLFYMILDGRNVLSKDKKQENTLNLVTHAWAYPSLQAKEEIKTDVEMGIFPVLGVNYAHKDPGAIAFGQLKPMEVYSHHANDDPNKTLYSPNNAHFKVDMDYPVQVFWAAGKQKNRIFITKFILINDYNHPIGAAVANSYRACPHLQEHLERLDKNMTTELQKMINPVIELFNNGKEKEGMEAFFKLNPSIQHLAFKHTYFLHKSPKVHHDFGRASFCSPHEVPPQYRSNSQQKGQALQEALKELIDVFVTSQKQLFANPKLVKDDREEQMLALAQKFRENDVEAMDWFNNCLEDEEKEGVFCSLWELKSSPKLYKYGTNHFYSKECSNEERAQAILLAISRF